MVRVREQVGSQLVEARIQTLTRNAQTPPAASGIRLVPALDGYTTSIRPVLWSVAATAALVLLIAGANLAVLMLVRGARRQREFAVRQALGASSQRLARLLTVEGLLLGAAASLISLAVSYVTVARLGPLVEQLLQRRVPGGLDALRMDVTAMIVSVVLAMVVTFVFAVLPLVLTIRGGLARFLASGGRAQTDGAGAGRSRSTLIAVEVAASLTLLAGAALTVESAMRMLRVEFGFDEREVVTASLALRQRTFPDEQAQLAFYDRLLSRLAVGGDGRSVALGDWWPLQGTRPRRIEAVGADSPAATGNPFVVTGGYFATLGIPLRDGRVFDAQDRLGGVPVVVVSESLARRLWPTGRAIGERLTIHLDDDGPIAASIVGVAGDVRQSHSDADTFDIYLPLAQHPGRFAFVYLRSPQSPGWERDLRAAVASVQSDVAVGAPRRLALGLEEERARPRFLAGMLSVVAIFAITLALVGMYGVITYAVRQRQREIAVRIAIGADFANVTGMFLRQGAVVLGAGLLAGLAGAAAIGRVLRSQLHEAAATEPRILAAAAVMLGACGLAAVWWPARRAASIDPARLLRED
jgi:predicted permease